MDTYVGDEHLGIVWVLNIMVYSEASVSGKGVLFTVQRLSVPFSRQKCMNRQGANGFVHFRKIVHSLECPLSIGSTVCYFGQVVKQASLVI